MQRTRREFLQDLLSLLGLGLLPPAALAEPLRKVGGSAPKNSGEGESVLVVVELAGGNDGLNTLIPRNGLYYDYRPNIGIPEEQTLPLNEEVAMNKALEPLKPLYDQGKVAWVQGVGYPNPDRSHFRSMDIWHTACPDKVVESGWLGRALRLMDPQGESPLLAVHLGPSLPKVFREKGVVVPSVTRLEAYGFLSHIQNPGGREAVMRVFEEVYGSEREAGNSLKRFIAETGLQAHASAEALKGATQGYTPKAPYPQGPLGLGLSAVARIHAARIGTRIFYLSYGGFDTHANQPNQHRALLSHWAQALAAFYEDLKAQGLAEKVVVMAFSEFGRRVKENASLGTDHGAAGPMLLLGDPVRGGLYGEHHPSLTDLDRGDLKYAHDFRRVYWTVLEKHLGLDPEPILEGSFEPLPLLRA